LRLFGSGLGLRSRPLIRDRQVVQNCSAAYKRWIARMMTLAFVIGILLGGKAGLFLALYVQGMGDSVVG
jgi:hypothetical protein